MLFWDDAGSALVVSLWRSIAQNNSEWSAVNALKEGGKAQYLAQVDGGADGDVGVGAVVAEHAGVVFFGLEVFRLEHEVWVRQ